MMCRRVVSKNVSTNCSVDELSCSHASVTVGVCFYLSERSRSARGKSHGELAWNRQTETSHFEAGGVHCIISSTKFTQGPQHMRHITTLFSARTPKVAHARCITPCVKLAFVYF